MAPACSARNRYLSGNVIFFFAFCFSISRISAKSCTLWNAGALGGRKTLVIYYYPILLIHGVNPGPT